jgi:uncharacterized protein (TIGR02284 family)
METPLTMQDIARTLATLSAMIAANAKRSKHYLTLAEKTDHHELKPLFTHYADQSRRFVSSLSTWRSAYGGLATMENNSAGPWIQIRSLLDFGLRKNMLVQCEELEQDMVRLYKSTINQSFLPIATEADVQGQVRDFEKALSKIRLLRERPTAEREVFART